MLEDVFEKIEIPIEEVTVDDVPSITIEQYFTETEFGGSEAYNFKIRRIAEMFFGVPFTTNLPKNKRSQKHGKRTNGYLYQLNTDNLYLSYQNIYRFTTYVMSHCFKLSIGDKNLCWLNLNPKYWKVVLSGMTRIASFVYDLSNKKRSYYFTYYYIQKNFIKNSEKNLLGLAEDGIKEIIFQSITKLKGRRIKGESISYNFRENDMADKALFNKRWMHCVAMGVALNKKNLVFKDERLSELEAYAIKTLNKEDIVSVYEYLSSRHFGYGEKWIPIYYMGFVYDYEKDFGAYVVFFPKIS